MPARIATTGIATPSPIPRAFELPPSPPSSPSPPSPSVAASLVGEDGSPEEAAVGDGDGVDSDVDSDVEDEVEVDDSVLEALDSEDGPLMMFPRVSIKVPRPRAQQLAMLLQQKLPSSQTSTRGKKKEAPAPFSSGKRKREDPVSPPTLIGAALEGGRVWLCTHHIHRWMRMSCRRRGQRRMVLGRTCSPPGLGSCRGGWACIVPPCRSMFPTRRTACCWDILDH